MTNFTISAAEFRALVAPVLPLACKDDMMPTLCAVLIEGDGKWLSATATDRFRMGIKRIAKRATDDDPATEWPEFRALVPLRSIKSLLTTFKTLRGSLPAQITFTIEDGKLTAEAAGAFDLFDSARFVHYLQDGEYPKVRSLVQQTLDIAVEDRVSAIHLDPFFLADWKAIGTKNLRFLMGKANGAILVTDDEGFIGLQMPRRSELRYEDWSDFLAPK
ncbi:MAG: hypothetical protein ACRDTJ_09290, partial [Pseudonocardiaceae bacterium]